MRKNLLYFLGGMASVFAVIGLFVLLIFIVASIVIDPLVASNSSANKDDVAVLAENVSPDKQHIATVYSKMGGGAAGYCNAEVNVRGNGTEFNEKEFVFVSHCGTQIKTEWESNERLQISYSSDDSIQEITQKAWSADKSVRISYREDK